LPQAELTDTVFTWLGRPYKIIYLALDEEEALRRQLSRAKTESRPDSDNEAKARARFEVFHARTEPVLEFFKSKGVLLEIDGKPTPAEIAQTIASELNLK
jgi:adenylate kinase